MPYNNILHHYLHATQRLCTVAVFQSPPRSTAVSGLIPSSVKSWVYTGVLSPERVCHVTISAMREHDLNLALVRQPTSAMSTLMLRRLTVTRHSVYTMLKGALRQHTSTPTHILMADAVFCRSAL